MDILEEKDCLHILEKAHPGKRLTVSQFRFESLENHVDGFLSSSQKLVIVYRVGSGVEETREYFFAKILPKGNDFHEKYVLSTRGFEKEVFFFEEIKPKLDEWMSESCLPTCYFTEVNKVVILELISDHRVKDISGYFDFNEIRSSIVSVASLHAASIMYESKNRVDLKSIWGDYFFDALYLRKEDHWGFRHTTNGIQAVKAIISQEFPQFSQQLKEKVFTIYDNLPELVEPSDRFRNVISHGDLYTNNIMFGTDSGSTRAKLVDFQLFRFNPPALDLLMLIYLTANLKVLKSKENLANLYYEQLSKAMEKFGFDVAVELPRKEFETSLCHYDAAALAITLLFQHYVNLPPDSLKRIMNEPSLLKQFILGDRKETVLTSFHADAPYRNKLTTTIKLLFDSL